MPFTFSHPAIVLPLINKYKKTFSATGLVIGSMAPDFESFIKFGQNKIHGHSWKGVVWFDMPMALVLTFVFHLIIKNSVIDHLPLSLRSRFVELRKFRWVSYFKDNWQVVFYSLFIGILSHMLWDAFTHLNLHYPDSIGSKIKFLNHRLYIWLQYVCSVIGLIAVFIYIYRLPKQYVEKQLNGKLVYWVSVLIVATSIIWYVAVLDMRNDPADFVDIINISISGVFYGVIIVSLIKNVITYKSMKNRI